MIVDAVFLTPYALLALRVIIAIVFFSSGKSHVKSPKERGESLGMSPALTSFVGIAEIAAAISIAFGVFTQVGAAIIMGVMVVAMYKKIIAWNTGFYADKGFGWHYDLMFFAGALVIFTTGGGYLVLV